jgi:predicted amidophosphoribosyltransferase
MAQLGEIALGALVALLSFGFLSLWGWVTLLLARRRHRSPMWFVAGLMGGFFAAALVAMLPDLEQHCPRCKSRFKVGAAHCEQCGTKLPTPNELARMGGDIGRHDRQCPSCQRPYSLSDYRPDALEIFCSWCKAPLPREAPQLPPEPGRSAPQSS